MDFAAWFLAPQWFPSVFVGKRGGTGETARCGRGCRKWCRVAEARPIERGNEKNITEQRAVTEPGPLQWWITVVSSRETSNFATARRWVSARRPLPALSLRAIRLFRVCDAMRYDAYSECGKIASARARALHFHSHPAIIMRAHLRNFANLVRDVLRQACCASRSCRKFLQRRVHATLVDRSHRTPLVRDKNYVMITGAVYSVYMCTLHDAGGSFKSALRRMPRKRCATIAEPLGTVRFNFLQNHMRAKYKI